MNTFEEQLEFFRSHQDGMKAAAESGGADGVKELIAGFSDPMERRVLFVFARRLLVHGEWQGKNLEAWVDVARAGIDECLRQSEAESTDELRDRRKDTANVISYNLAADLADCWPEGGARTTAHFEAGLAAANDCVRWREELAKPPGPRSMAWWAKGMHELSLGRASDAVTSFEKSRDYAVAAAEGDETAFGVVLGDGYAALAQQAAGDAAGAARYERAIGVFRSQLADEETKGDAQFGIDQLETVRGRYG